MNKHVSAASVWQTTPQPTQCSPYALNDPEPSLSQLYWSERNGLFRYALKILGHTEEAEDVVHDCYLRVIHQEQQKIEVLHQRAWLFRIVRNRCIDHMRLRKRAQNAFDNSDIAVSLHSEGAQSMTPERQLVSSDLLQTARAAMQNLPADEAQTLSLAVVEGLTYQEIASITGVPVGTVRSRLNRARRLLRRLLDGHDDGNRVAKASFHKDCSP